MANGECNRFRSLSEKPTFFSHSFSSFVSWFDVKTQSIDVLVEKNCNTFELHHSHARPTTRRSFIYIWNACRLEWVRCHFGNCYEDGTKFSLNTTTLKWNEIIIIIGACCLFISSVDRRRRLIFYDKKKTSNHFSQPNRRWMEHKRMIICKMNSERWSN